MIIWWEYIYNLERPHQGIGNLTPYEKLKSLGYTVTEEICLFPPLILDKVCMLDIFQLKRRKSVQDHLDLDPQCEHDESLQQDEQILDASFYICSKKEK